MFLGRRLRLPRKSALTFSAAASRVLARDEVWVGLGLLITLAAAWRVVTTPGEIIHGDLQYPFATEFWIRPYTSAWDVSDGSALLSFLRTYTYLPWGLVIQAFELSPEAASKFHWLSWHLLGFLAGYVGARLLVGPQIRASHPIAVRVGLVLAGLFWALNPWTLARWEQLGVHVSAVMLPMVVGLAVAATRARDRRTRWLRALAAAAAQALAVSTSPHYMALGVLVGLGWFVYAAVTSPGRRRPMAGTAMVFLSGYVTFAAFILVPYVVADVAGSATGPINTSPGQTISVSWPTHSISNTLTLTGHESGWPFLRPSIPGAWPGWRAAAMVPAALALVAFWRLPGHRRMLGYAVILGGVTALLQIATYHEATRPAFLHVVAEAPFGWALRSPDKLSGALAVAYLPGIALAPAIFARDAPRRLPIVGAVQTLALGLVLAAYALPAINWALLDERAVLVPERFPASFHTVPAELDQRNADWASRTLIAAWLHRHPEWSSSSRVLHFVERLAVTTPAVNDTAKDARLVGLVTADAPKLTDTLRAHGVARVLAPTGTPRGQDLAQRLRRTDGLELDFAEGYYEVFRTVEPPYPWVYEETPAGRVELPWRREGMNRLVIDVPPGLDEPREIVTQEYWDPLWTAHSSRHEAAVERSARGLLSVRLEPGAHGPLILEHSLQRALVAGHAITWTGLVACGVWAAWLRRPWRRQGHS